MRFVQLVDGRDNQAPHIGAPIASALVTSDLDIQRLAKRYVFETLWRERVGEDHPHLNPRVDRSYQRFTEVLENHYLTHAITPTEGCLSTFNFLRERQKPIALTTGFYRKVTDIILGKLGWLNGLNDQHLGTSQTTIQLSIASDEVEKGRPYPIMIQKAMQLLGVTEAKTVVNSGDTPADLLSGRAAGVGLNLGVTNGTHTRGQLSDYASDALLNSLRELPALLSERLATAPVSLMKS